ncbi:unnamed protein product [Cuscuta epithymum]|uniref:F-box domain-containing protein n=1 Tax=Cuscuta epithymum TaxID=186058 RepID=A0AAV0CKK5_9ASTE|nr:unnamed protein product [Cuscuta epithymum]
MNEDVVTEILLRLPPKSVYRFRLVSKAWNHTITFNPFFIERYDSNLLRREGGRRLLALFQNTIARLYYPYQPESFEDFLNILSFNGNSGIRNQSPELGSFINSSNGLILCSGARNRHEYHVVNPVTRKFVTLPPPPPLPAQDEYVALMCVENKVELAAKFSVIRIESIPNKCQLTFGIRAYSSETGAWAAEPTVIVAHTAILNLRVYLDPGSPFVMNGIYHWHTVQKTKLVLYRPAEEHIQIIQISDDCGITVSAATIRRTPIDAGDVLWFARMERKTIKVFMLPKDIQPRPSFVACQEWVLKYDIRVDSLWNDSLLIPLKWEQPWRKIILDAFVPINDNNSKKKKKKKNTAPFDIIMRVENAEAFLFHLDTESINYLEYEGSPVYEGHYVQNYPLHPYLEPPFLSTYAL